jgi:subtilisin family serine protease
MQPMAVDLLRLLCPLCPPCLLGLLGPLCRACTTCTEEKWTGVQPEPGTPAYSNYSGGLPLLPAVAVAAAVSMSGYCRHGLRRLYRWHLFLTAAALHALGSSWLNGGTACVRTYRGADTNGHGSHVAGTLGAAGNNTVGVAGVAYNVRVPPPFLPPATRIAVCPPAGAVAAAAGRSCCPWVVLDDC